jgi:plasmid stabilization system protein ParE
MVQGQAPTGDPEKFSGNTEGARHSKGVVMRKMMLTLTTVGLLAVPTGMALAQTDTPEPATPVPTCVDPQQDRVQDRDRDRIHTVDQAGPEAQEQLRTRLRTHAQVHDGDGPGAGPGQGQGGGPGDGATHRHQYEISNG